VIASVVVAAEVAISIMDVLRRHEGDAAARPDRL
jgi:hypothetical protein